MFSVPLFACKMATPHTQEHIYIAHTLNIRYTHTGLSVLYIETFDTSNYYHHIGKGIILYYDSPTTTLLPRLLPASVDILKHNHDVAISPHPSELPMLSPLLHSVLRTLDLWVGGLVAHLESKRGPPPEYIPGCFAESNVPGPPIHKYRALLETHNTPFAWVPSYLEVTKFTNNTKFIFNLFFHFLISWI